MATGWDEGSSSFRRIENFQCPILGYQHAFEVGNDTNFMVRVAHSKQNVEEECGNIFRNNNFSHNLIVYGVIHFFRVWINSDDI